jgi:hypothetical protein
VEFRWRKARTRLELTQYVGIPGKLPKYRYMLAITDDCSWPRQNSGQLATPRVFEDPEVWRHLLRNFKAAGANVDTWVE